MSTAALVMPRLWSGPGTVLSDLGSDVVVVTSPSVVDRLGDLGLGASSRPLLVSAASSAEVARVRDELTSRAPAAMVAVGGGKVLDVAKLASRTAEASAGKLTPGGPSIAQIIAVPTTCGSGSDASSIAVISEDSGKRPYRDDVLRFDGVVHVPRLLTSLSPTAAGAALFDGLAHAIEGGLSAIAQDVHRSLAAVLIRALVPLMGRLEEWLGADSDDGRSEAQVLSTFAGALQDSTSVGLAHGLAHSYEAIGGQGSHGAVIGALLPDVLRWNSEASPKIEALALAAGFGGATALIAELDALVAGLGLSAPQLPATTEFATRVARDPCTRTNCRLVRPKELVTWLSSR